MNRRQTALFIISFIVLAGAAHSFENNGKVPENLLQQIETAYNSFDMKKSVELLSIAITSLASFESSDRAEIYKYAALIACQNDNNALGADHFWNLLNIDPTYTLDPVTTSPKVLALFQKVKIEYLEDQNKRLPALQRQTVQAKAPSRRALVPGLEQIKNGQKIKGGIFASASVISLSGLAIAIFKTGAAKENYTNETNPDLIPGLYTDYNRYYKTQYYFAYVLAATWALSQIDLVLWSPSEIEIALAPQYQQISNAISAELSIRF